jgi:competence protein ComEA
MGKPPASDQKEDRPLTSEQKVFLALLLLVLLGLHWIRINGSPLPWPPKPKSSSPHPDAWVVEVQGCLDSPGIYTFPSPVDVQDVLVAAGVTPHIPSEAVPSITLETGTTLILSQGDGRLSVHMEPMDAAKRILYHIPFDLNRAQAEDLVLIPGIGPILAQRILDYRNKTQRFSRLADLQSVSGIGPKKFESFRPYLYVEDVPSPTP